MPHRFVLISLVLAPLALAAAPIPPEGNATRLLRIYGEWSDPEMNSQYKFDPFDRNRLQVVIPARALTESDITQARKPLFETDKLKPEPVRSPRFWKEVSGDFVAEVQVSFPLHPKAQPQLATDMPRVAGLVAWVNDENHIGFIRGQDMSSGRSRERFCQMHRVAQSGRTVVSDLKAARGDAAYLRLKRCGNAVTGSYSRDGKAWTEFLPDEVDWKGAVKVGVYARNLSDEPLTVVFSGYTLARPKK